MCTWALDFRINRLTSLESGGVAACSGFDSKVATGRKIHFIKETDELTPHGVGSIPDNAYQYQNY